MDQIREAILSGDRTEQTYAGIEVPKTYRAATVHKDEALMFEGLASRDKDPRKSLHVEQVPTPELAPGEALVAVMASAINYNTVWTSIFEPVSTFGFLERYGRTSEFAKRHDRDYAGHDDTMMDPQQRIWGFETNFGGLAELAIVKANQLMPKPTHLSWEEAASPGLVNSTAYRQLISRNGAHMKLGDRVLIWGASGGLGSYATQMALAGGATPMGKKIRELTGGHDVDIVFEHPGRETFGASVYVARKGGTIVTCASTSGYMHEYDNRYLWMNLKRIVSSHFANYREAWEANDLIDRGLIHPTLSRTYRLEDVGTAALDVHRNLHQGKVGVLTLSPEEGLGVSNPEKRARFESEINRFRNA